MKKYLKKIIAGLTLAIAIPASAQELASTYFQETSVFNHQLNPALLKEGNFSFLLGNFNMSVGMNAGATNFIFDNPDYQAAGKANRGYRFTTFMHPGIDFNSFSNEMPDNVRFNMGFNWNILSVAFNKWKGTNLIEINLRSQTGMALPKDFFSFLKTAGSAENYTFDDLAFRSQNYVELALGHSRKINDQWRVGGKMKLLFGAAYADFKANNFDITMNGNKWAIQGDAEMNMALCETQLTRSNDKGQEVPMQAGDKFSDMDIDEVKAGLSGMGVAFDFGATYKAPIEGHDLTVSVAVTDLGFINWKNTHTAATKASWEFDGFDNEIYMGSGDKQKGDLGKQFEKLGDDLEDVFDLKYAGKSKKRQALAMTLNIGAEYKLPMYDKLRFGLLYSGRMGHIYKNHQGVLSVGIRPAKCFEFLANVTTSTYGWSYGGILSLRARHFNLHLAAQAPFSKFSKDMIPLNNTNAHFNFGMTFPL